MKESQAFSMDIMLAVIIFIGTAFFFFTILNQKQGSKAEELQDEASKVLSTIISDDSDVGILNGSEINVEKLEDLLGNYSNIKNKLRIKNEFCFFFEDEDGNIIFINISETKNFTGIGSGTINVSNIPCG